jgi:polyferredoxin
MNKQNPYILPLMVFLFVALILAIVQINVQSPMILLERFLPGGGWIEISFVALYGALVTWKMQDPKNVVKWRRNTWLLFSVVFFGQLFLGIIGFDKFLMTGKLHLPVPAMILSGPLYRAELSFMTILFVSTVILSGPAWCSHLCYFGAMDNFAASKRKPGFKGIKNKWAIKYTLLLLVILGTLLLRWFNVSWFASAIAGGLFGLTGLGIILIISRKKGKMVHCVVYCPIGTIVNYTRFINPFRMYIDNSCTFCMKCTSTCNYDALNPEDIKNEKPGLSCTLCGDCVSSCHANSIKYKFFKMKPAAARNLYLFITISIHAVFMALARL